LIIHHLSIVVHWPVAFTSGSKVDPLFPPHPTKPNEVEIDTTTSLVDTWKEFIKLPATGKVKAIGVSNFTVEYLEAIINATGVIPVSILSFMIVSSLSCNLRVYKAVNQIEAHPYLPQDDLVAYHKKKNIHISAYSPSGNNCKQDKCGHGV
jgi:L-glyceraldehyde reductase